MSDSNRLALAETGQVTSVGVTPRLVRFSRQQNAGVLIWLRPGEQVSEAFPAVFAPPKLDSHHPGQGLGGLRTVRSRKVSRRASTGAVPSRKIMTRCCAEMMWSRASTKV
jgi:hypothetical protein